LGEELGEVSDVEWDVESLLVFVVELALEWGVG
jgi:hypothetical protein